MITFLLKILKRRVVPLGLLLLAPVIPAQSEIIFSGDQDGYIEEGDYLASGTLTVRRGKTLTFAPGCIVRFKQYCGMVVEGALKCPGKPGAPIVFTSENNRPALPGQNSRAPGPFDWNGIIVADSSSSATMEYTRVAYSIYGLDVKSDSSKVKLDKAVFTDNGHSSIRVNGRQLEVKDNEPFSYVQPTPDTDMVPLKKPSIEEPEAPSQPPVKTMAAKKTAPWKFPVRLGLGAIAAVGLGVAVYEHLQAEKYYPNYHDPQVTQNANENANNGSIVNDNQSKIQKAVKLRDIGQIIAAIAGLGLGITFFF